MGRKAKVTDKHRNVARGLRRGLTGRQALREAGYTATSAKKGITVMQREIPALAEAINQEIAQQARELIAKQDHRLSKAELEQVVETALIRNTLHGEGERKGSSYAAKLLGSLSRVNLFEPDISVGVLALPVPEEWKDRYSGKVALKEATSLPEQLHTGTDLSTTKTDGTDTVSTGSAASESVPPSEPPVEESKQATIGDADTPALPPAPEPTVEPQQET
jgi:hypothetical protein